MSISVFMVHTVSVATKTGEGSYGPVLATPVTVAGVQVDEETRLVRSPTGAEVTSSTTIRGPLPKADQFTVGSQVTLPSGDTTTVLSLSRLTSAPVLAALAHFEAACS